MKVLLISANTLREPYPVYPLGLDYVAGAIAENHQVQIVDMNTLDGYDSLAAAIKKFAPDVIGLSLRNIDNTDTTDPKGFFGQYRSIVDVIRKNSDARLILGGSGFTIFPAETMQALGADYGVIGEGERLALLLDALENRKDAGKMPGVVSPETHRSLPEPWKGKITRRINPDPANLRFYLQNGGMLNLQTKRGCHFKCVYCTYPHIEGHHLRLVDPDETAAAALKLQASGAKYFFVTDSVFNADCSHSLAVARAFKKNGVSIPWGAFFAPLKQPDDYFRIMADAGLTHVEFGTDSLSNSVLAVYRKPFRDQQIIEIHQAAIAAGLYVAHYFLLGGPGENPQTLKETLAGASSLEKSALFFFCGMRIYPGTELYEIAVNEGQVERGLSILEPVFYRSPLIDSDKIVSQVRQAAGDRINWVIGAGGEDTAKIISELYQRGHCGPMWEYLIRLS
ncbi:MAG: lipid biosynthesis B12-binding/radical SAM protein [Desulfobacterales bacterium]